MYIYIYIERERYTHIHIHIYIYIIRALMISIHEERARVVQQEAFSAAVEEI